MTGDPPDPPAIPADVREALEGQDSETLDEIARYAEELASASRGDGSEDGATDENDDVPPDGNEDEAADGDDQESEDEAADGDDQESEDEAADGDDREDEEREVPGDRPEAVPSKATVVVKEINDNRYYYWQWREGDSVKSRYEGPVDPDR